MNKSVLVIGFNTRPLVYSLFKSGYRVLAIDFFGDEDLYPYVEDSVILTKELGSDYRALKDTYSDILADFTIDYIKSNPNVDSIIIGSGLDDAIEQREKIYRELDKCSMLIQNLNNDIQIIKKARDIFSLYKYLGDIEYKTPLTIPFERFHHKSDSIRFPFILKKKSSAGGTSVFKIRDHHHFQNLIDVLNIAKDSSEWIIQEFIQGNPISSTIISNGEESELISINRQIIGLAFLNPPKNFMYCGNVVPSYIREDLKETITEISIKLTHKLGLKGINGFDFVVRDGNPYLMEINPRIPGSIRASEEAFNLNLLDLHVKSFRDNSWPEIRNSIRNSERKNYATKLIFFAPKRITPKEVKQINNLEFVHDKTISTNYIEKDSPVCSILYNNKTFANSYFGALKIADKIKLIINH
ncbi:MAG: ATP-grasp domain-containing protein [Candidatus Lokiarchaeota archaeon]|nr:ATP-grasp domain-containing protein [Candidatus Lokiarchaeota archaeon]MBD3200905.1 ATP-grasp domain-containing protein [Candidatus Lokiarchaeota archaeon]